VTAAAPARVLCVNCGSSSVKVATYRVGERVERLDGEAGGADATGDVLARLAARGALDVDAVGHRLVHGGPDLFDPTVVDDALLARLRALVGFAPLHLPAALRAIDATRARLPGVPNVVCFDTAFHRGLPDVARRLPLPDDVTARGVHRYGFHGLSYEYVVGALGDDARGRVVIAHLGNGASLAAVKDGACVDTTMGMTPTGGVMMGTRTGDLDPGVLIHLLRDGYDVERLERLVERESGLLGVSAATADVKELLARRAEDPRADLALRMFVYGVAKAIGALAAALGGLDRLVFTGGIGEHAAPVRDAITARLAFLGPVDVRVIATDEDHVIAVHTARTACVRAQPVR
jgi:acetate kinase